MDKNSVQAFGDSNRGAISIGPRFDLSTGTSVRPTASVMWNGQAHATAYGMNVSQQLGSSGWRVNAGGNTGGGYSFGISGRW